MQNQEAKLLAALIKGVQSLTGWQEIHNLIYISSTYGLSISCNWYKYCIPELPRISPKRKIKYNPTSCVSISSIFHWILTEATRRNPTTNYSARKFDRRNGGKKPHMASSLSFQGWSCSQCSQTPQILCTWSSFISPHAVIDLQRSPQ